MLVRYAWTAKENAMSPTHIPGDEPDADDVSTEPGMGTPDDRPAEHDLPDDEAEKRVISPKSGPMLRSHAPSILEFTHCDQ